MKSLVIYDSNYGNTKKIAETIAEVLLCRAVSVTEISANDLNDLELIIVGSPINAWRPTSRIKDFLNNLPAGRLTGIKAAAFDTRVKIFISGNAAKKISKSLGEKGATIIAEPQGFYVKDNEGPLAEGEIENAKKWAHGMLKK